MSSQPKSVTIENLEAAFAGESMAHIKYRYFAKLARSRSLKRSRPPPTRKFSTRLATSICSTRRTR
jgi:hypothetical protein